MNFATWNRNGRCCWGFDICNHQHALELIAEQKGTVATKSARCPVCEHKIEAGKLIEKAPGYKPWLHARCAGAILADRWFEPGTPAYRAAEMLLSG